MGEDGSGVLTGVTGSGLDSIVADTVIVSAVLSGRGGTGGRTGSGFMTEENDASIEDTDEDCCSSVLSFLPALDVLCL